MAGENTNPYFMDVYKALSIWFPQAENVVLPDANHCIHHSNPAGAAEYLADFFSRHPINEL